MRENKDEKLDKLFKSYVEEEKTPDESVTKKAIEFMRANPQKEEVPVAETAAATAGESANIGGVRRNYVVAGAALFMALCVALIFYFVIKASSDSPDFALSSSVSEAQLEETEGDISPSSAGEDGFLRFIEYDSVTLYCEYALTEDAAGYSAGDVVVYYVEYVADGKEIMLYVEAENIYLDSIAFYKECENEQTYSGTTFLYYINGEAATSYAYFQVGAYGYNMEILTSDKDVLFGLLKAIAEKI